MQTMGTQNAPVIAHAPTIDAMVQLRLRQQYTQALSALVNGLMVAPQAGDVLINTFAAQFGVAPFPFEG